MRNLLLEQPAVRAHSGEIYWALVANIPFALALYLSDTFVWLLVSFLYLAFGITQAYRWSSLTAAWWTGWTLLSLCSTVLHFLPFAHAAATTTLLVALIPLLFSLFCLICLWYKQGLYASFGLLPIALEFYRLILFRDLPTQPQTDLPMLLAAGLLYPLVTLGVYHYHTRRRRWLVLLVGTLVYATAAGLLAWPTLLGMFIFLDYLGMLGLILALPVLGGYVFHRLQRLRPLSTGGLKAAVLPALLIGILLWAMASYYPPASTAAQPLPPSPATRQKLIVDTDMSFDDYAALIYLLQDPDVEVVAITSVQGVADTAYSVVNIQRLLALTGQSDIPVALGAAAPLNGQRVFPSLWTNALNLVFRPYLPPAGESRPPAAADLLQTSLSTHDDVAIMALGPLTNIAQLLQSNPTLAAQIPQIIVSGGAVEASDTTNEMEKDWNLWLDPEATHFVLASGANLVFAPLDLTHADLRFNRPFVDQLTAAAQTRGTQFIGQVLSKLLWAAGDEPQPVWDVTAAVVALHPDLCTRWQTLPLATQTAGETAGFLRIDTNAPPNARLCLAGDQQAFESTLLSIMR